MVKDKGNLLTAGRAYNSRIWEVELGHLEVQGHPWLASIEISLVLRNSVSKRRGWGEGEGKWKGKKGMKTTQRKKWTVRVSGIWNARGQAVCEELWSREVTPQGIWSRKGEDWRLQPHPLFSFLLQESLTNSNET